MEKQNIGWSKNSLNPLRNFLSKTSKPLISISIQNEAEPLNPDETDHLSLAQLKQQKQTKKGRSQNGHTWPPKPKRRQQIQGKMQFTVHN